MMFHAQKVIVKPRSARIGVLGLTCLNGRGTCSRASHELSSPLSGVRGAVTGADRGPASVCWGGSRSRQIIAAPVDDVGAEQVVQRNCEGVHQRA